MDTATTARHANLEPDPPRFENTYAGLPGRFFSRTEANRVAAPKPIKLNEPLAKDLGIDPAFLRSEAGIAMLAGNAFPEGSTPLAMAYAGHQFGNFVPQLGDGRAMLIGERTDTAGVRRDVQLKGSGPTAFSRNGDGRAALGPVLREYLVSEAMHALGIPTTRSLAAVLTGESVYRETKLPGAVLTRIAASHIRIGTFQFFAARGDVDGIRTLADYAVARHYPHLAGHDTPYLALLEAVIARQASLMAQWMLVGFIHGVMNTDNMSISGETIDYGPCAFMDAYHPNTVFSSIDQFGRYAYGNQPGIAVWNLARLAEALLPLLHDDRDEGVKLAENALKGFQSTYHAAFHPGLRRMIGLKTEEEGDLQLVSDLLDAMARNQADFTLTFRSLAGEVETKGGTRQFFAQPAEFDLWAERWHERLSRQPQPADPADIMRKSNPKYIPRNHRVEQVIQAAVEREDFAPFEELLSVVTRPFDEQPQHDAYTQPPKDEERVLRTFCGT
jgi:uncharacterized protein YdiU (UPF0061 family)